MPNQTRDSSTPPLFTIAAAIATDLEYSAMASSDSPSSTFETGEADSASSTFNYSLAFCTAAEFSDFLITGFVLCLTLIITF